MMIIHLYGEFGQQPPPPHPHPPQGKFKRYAFGNHSKSFIITALQGNGNKYMQIALCLLLHQQISR